MDQSIGIRSQVKAISYPDEHHAPRPAPAIRLASDIRARGQTVRGLHASGHPVRRLGHAPVAAVAGHVSKAVHPLFPGPGLAAFSSSTLKRLPASAGFAAPIIIGNNDHRFLIEEEAARAGVSPLRRHPRAGGAQHGTRDCGCRPRRRHARTQPASWSVMPSDHVIKDEPGFVAAVRRAAEVAATGKFVAVRHQAGVDRTPATATSGAGRRCRGSRAPTASMRSPRSPTRRRPNATLRPATTSGTAASSCWALAPSSRSWRGWSPISSRRPAKRSPGPRRIWVSCASTHKPSRSAPAISVDYAVMERTGSAAVLPLDIGWNDVGSWSSLWEMAPHDAQGNAVEGDALLESTSDCYIHSERALVATIGVKDLVIVDTPDALLVADRVQGAGRLAASSRSLEARQAQGARAAPAQLPPVGLLRDAEPRPALPGQAAARQARRQALHADAPPPLRALGGGARHGQGDDRRRGEAGARERVRLHRRHPMAPPGESRQDRRWR